MPDFFRIAKRHPKKGVIEIYPSFIARQSSDLMVRGGDFYAVWLESKKCWSTNEFDAIDLIDHELGRYFNEHKSEFGDDTVRVLYLRYAETGMIDRWHSYCKKQMPDHFHPLDETLIFADTPKVRENYSTRSLSYELKPGTYENYDELMSVLYSDEERHKIEWAIGAIITGASKDIQKFMVLYGAPGTGKSTVLNIIQDIFQGYSSTFDSKALGAANSSFALESFRDNPLVAIDHEGDLSRIETNTRINTLVAHEPMIINEKFKSTYTARFISFLIIGTNKPVRISDAKSGLMRRLIDVSPTGEKLGKRDYKRLMKKIKFELGAIAWHCKEVFEEDPDIYDNYAPVSMLGATNDFYNFIVDSYSEFESEDATTLKKAWEMWKEYSEYSNIGYSMPQRRFRDELSNYFREYKDRHVLNDGTRVRSCFIGFKKDIFTNSADERKLTKSNPWLELKPYPYSQLDILCSDSLAQYATTKETPRKPWEKVATVLRDLDSSKLHYLKPRDDISLVVIDLDLKDESGNKSLLKNLEAASYFPETYAEVSKGGNGLHLHYIYEGDLSKLSCIYSPGIEVKIFTGGSSLRRKLSLCNNLKIAKMPVGGLPLKVEKPDVVNEKTVLNERAIRTIIARSIRKEYQPGTKPNVEFIKHILDQAYEAGIQYDVSDLEAAIYQFASGSTHHASYCVKLLDDIQFKSDAVSEKEALENTDSIVFFDVEVFPNLFVVCWKTKDSDEVVGWVNPGQDDILKLMRFKLVGFNNRKYDNHILWARSLGYSNADLYSLSNSIINDKGSKNTFGEAYNISYTDIYDFSSKKQSLKKFEIELGIHHKELGLPWDKPVAEEDIPKVVEYCKYDVLATEATFKAREGDFIAREILADVAGGTVNDTTNSLTTKIIFGNDKEPQKEFNYRNLNELFPGYEYKCGKSTYRGEEVGEGGYVYSEPGIYTDVGLLDIASQHPSTIVAENLFGKYTKRFKDILQARIAIKHGDYEKAGTMLEGKLKPYLTDKSKAKDLAQALKIAINSVYGLTSAGFSNKFKDPRNIDNIVAKRGALFMIDLKHAVQEKGYKVVHIKTDSIKIEKADNYIINFVQEFGKKYDYNFEHECTYDRMCLVNDAVYIAKYLDKDSCMEKYGYIPEKNVDHGDEWTATGKQFAVPYVFKSIFTKKPIEFSDLCETKEVSGGASIYLDFNESLPDVSSEEHLLDIREKYRLGMKVSKKDLSKIEQSIDISDEQLKERAAAGHCYSFVGRVGNFCPVKPGTGGGVLIRRGKDNDKDYAVTGTKGYLWKEAEALKSLNQTDDVDLTYFNHLVEDAIEAIKKYGDYEQFVYDI